MSSEQYRPAGQLKMNSQPTNFRPSKKYPEFTSLTLENGIIATSHGIEYDEKVIASIMYIPDRSGTAHNPQTGQKYLKNLWNGPQHELATGASSIPNSIQTYLDFPFGVHQSTCSIPKVEISQAVSPFNQTSPPINPYCAAILEKVSLSHDERVGLYGADLVPLVRPAYRDVDVVLYGAAKGSIIIKEFAERFGASANPAGLLKHSEDKKIQRLEYFSRASRKSSVHINGVRTDMRTSRNSEEQLLFMDTLNRFSSTAKQDNSSVFKLKITNNELSYGFNAQYTAMHGNDHILLTFIGYFVATFDPGDEVVVKGIRFSPNEIICFPDAPNSFVAF